MCADKIKKDLQNEYDEYDEYNEYDDEELEEAIINLYAQSIMESEALDEEINEALENGIDD